jgi:hypothetical protein
MEKIVLQSVLIKKSVDVLQMMDILIQWDEVQLYDYKLLLVC